VRNAGMAAAVLLAALAGVSGTLTGAFATTTTLTAVADAFVLSSSPNANRGSSRDLRINDDVKRSYVRFRLSGLPPGESVTKATLKVFATSDSRCSLGAEVFRAANNTWTESAITWNNQPGTNGSVVASRASWTVNTWVNFDVTSAVSGGSAISFVLRHKPGCNVTGDATLQSREATRKPKLAVETVPAPPPQCSDGIDNDSDGKADFPADPGCIDANDNDETDVQLGRPNILVVMTDDQRASSDGLSVMDDLWRIYGDGGTYYANAAVTTALCCPSRASTFAGRYAHNTGVIDNNGDPLDQTTTMQYHLQNLGYKTALTGKYLNDFTGTPPYFDLLALRVGYYDSNGSYGTTYIKDKAIDFLQVFEQNDAQPWLMYIHPFAPHSDSVPEDKYKSAFVPVWEDNPANTETDLSDKPRYVATQAANTSKSDIKNLRSRMIRTLYSVDDLIAAVFAKLKALGETNTLAFFLSDNGYQWYEHQLSGKGHAYDDSHRVPFFMRWPGHVAAGGIDRKIVANIDVAPTVYDALGYQPDNYAPDGRSIFTSQRDVILTEGFGRGYKGLWNPDWMYAEYRDGSLEYYGPNDPWQLDNSFKTGSPPANAEELNRQLGGYKNCVGVACP
jgi:arylsulfatase A-like enzyme